MDYIQHRLLCYDCSLDSFHLMGYPLSLSPTEHCLLKAILVHERQTFEELAEQLGRPLRPGAIAVHVHAINKKAMSISGRKLVEYFHGAYRIVYWM